MDCDVCRVEMYDMIYYEDKAAVELRAVVQELADADVLTGRCRLALKLILTLTLTGRTDLKLLSLHCSFEMCCSC